jgi:hypothetical protein
LVRFFDLLSESFGNTGGWEGSKGNFDSTTPLANLVRLVGSPRGVFVAKDILFPLELTIATVLHILNIKLLLFNY